MDKKQSKNFNGHKLLGGFLKSISQTMRPEIDGRPDFDRPDGGGFDTGDPGGGGGPDDNTPCGLGHVECPDDVCSKCFNDDPNAAQLGCNCGSEARFTFKIKEVIGRYERRADRTKIEKIIVNVYGYQDDDFNSNPNNCSDCAYPGSRIRYKLKSRPNNLGIPSEEEGYITPGGPGVHGPNGQSHQILPRNFYIKGAGCLGTQEQCQDAPNNDLFLDLAYYKSDNRVNHKEPCPKVCKVNFFGDILLEDAYEWGTPGGSCPPPARDCPMNIALRGNDQPGKPATCQSEGCPPNVGSKSRGSEFQGADQSAAFGINVYSRYPCPC